MASTYLSLNYHIIFSTKGRTPMIQEKWEGRLHRYLSGCISGLGGTPHVVGGVEDHVHLLVTLKATNRLADLVREVKKSSSEWVHNEIKSTDFGWQEGYGAFSVSAENCPAVSQYISSQRNHHKQWSSADEFRSILKEHGLEIDERYFK